MNPQRWFALVCCVIGLAPGTAWALPTLTPEVLLPSAVGTDAYRPAVAFGASTYLVVWQAGRIGAGDLVGIRLDATGAPIDAQPFAVSTATDDQERPHIAFGGGVFLVVWQDLRNGKDYDTYAARVTPGGKLLDPGGVLIAGGPHNQSNPVVTFDGTSFLVAWEDLRDGQFYAIYGARVGTDGKVADPNGLLIASDKTGGYHRLQPAIASQGGGRSLVVWHGSTVRDLAPPPLLWGGVFVKGGAVEASFGLAGNDERNAGVPGPGCPITLAASPSGFLAAWRNWLPIGRGNGSPIGNMVLLSATDGSEGTPAMLLGRKHYVVDPSSIWDGAEYVTAWAEQRHDPNVPPPDFDAAYAVTTGADGTILSGEIAVAGTLANPAKSLAVASDGARHTVMVYERHPSVGTEPIRVGVRVLQVQ